MTVYITDSWERLTVSPKTGTVRALFFRLSCGCIAKVDTPVLLASCSNQTLARAMSQLAELHHCPQSDESPALPDSTGTMPAE